MARFLYVWQKDFPWDIRADKICRALVRAGHDVKILARWQHGTMPREYWDDGIEIVRVGFGKKSALTLPLSINPLWRQALQQICIEWKPNVIIPREIMLAEACAAVGKKLHIPVVIDMAEHYPGAMRDWKKYSANPFLRFAVHTARIPDMVERRAVARADGIITVCQENTERLVREYGFPPEKNAIVHNTPVHLFSDEEIPPAPPPNRIFGYHGFVTAERNLELFVEGFALALEDLRAKHVEHPETPTLLHIAGHGETLADVQRTSKRLGIEENVVLLGAYSHSTLPGLYAQTHFGIVPSVDSAFINHTIANKVFDYMACGRPVLVSNVRPMRRVIEETGAGVVADCTRSTSIADAIIGMRMMSQEQYHAMAKAGKNAIATKYNWQTDTQTMLDFLERFIK